MNIFGQSIGNESKEDKERRINRDKFIWNEAIEAAAIKADHYSYEASVNIRKLNKWKRKQLY